MALDAERRDVYELLNRRKYIIRENQRQYVWKKDNWRELIDDISLVYEKNVDEHFIGSVVLMEEPKREGFREVYSIIDGQQRISTLTIALIGISLLFLDLKEENLYLNTLENLFVRDEDNNKHPIVSNEANRDICELVTSLPLVFDSMKKQPSLGMEREYTSLSELFKIVKPSKLIYDCLVFFYDTLKKKVENETNPTEALKIYRKILFNIRYIEIVAKDRENAYSIFEVLNARGQMLKEHELLRNYMLRYATFKQKKSINCKLDDIETLLGDDYDIFLKHYALHKYNKRTQNKEGNRSYKIITIHEKGRDMELLAEDLHLKASFYAKMSDADSKTCTPLERKVFSYFKRRRQQQFKPLIMGVMNQLHCGNITQDIYEKWIVFLYRFFICYHVIGGMTSNRIDDVVGKYSFLVENRYESNLLINFKNSVIKSIPNVQNFIAKMKGLTYSHKWTPHREKTYRENIRAIFEILEEILGYGGNYDELTIEHCHNDSEDENNSHVGNMMLLEKDLNEKCCNKNLQSKCVIYASSRMHYPKEIADIIRNNGDLDAERQTEVIARMIHTAIHSSFLE